ncbi:hypothetical protein HK105_208642 [Polyrhizophydium stewartii]|uniref:RING-type domain-containing protein n=1 Tax=Polyrhizophydium stewartii TaxID=2732419 RepID=A0ABR4MX31_9FUNG
MDAAPPRTSYQSGNGGETTFEWLHCNRQAAIRMPRDPPHFNHPLQRHLAPQRFHVGECGHIACSACLQRASLSYDPSGGLPAARHDGDSHGPLDISICPACSKPVQMIPAEVERVLSPMPSVLDDAVRVARFQHDNALALIRSLKRTNAFLKAKAVEYQRRLKQTHECVPHSGCI